MSGRCSGRLRCARCMLALAWKLLRLRIATSLRVEGHLGFLPTGQTLVILGLCLVLLNQEPNIGELWLESAAGDDFGGDALHDGHV